MGHKIQDLDEDFYTKYSKQEDEENVEPEEELFDDSLFDQNNNVLNNNVSMNAGNDLFGNSKKDIKMKEKYRQESMEEYMDQMEEFLNKKKNKANTKEIEELQEDIDYYDDSNTNVANYFTNFEQMQKRENRASDIFVYIFLIIVLLFSIYMIFGNN